MPSSQTQPLLGPRSGPFYTADSVRDSVPSDSDSVVLSSSDDGSSELHDSAYPVAEGGFGGFAPQFFGGQQDVDEAVNAALRRKSATAPRTWDGVFLPVSLAIFGAVLFLRLPWCIGQAGLHLTLWAIVICFSLSGLTLISLAAMSTNGLVSQGGPYMMSSRTLGPQIGLAIGVLFVIANIIASALYLVATAPAVAKASDIPAITNFHREHSYESATIIATLFLGILLAVGLLHFEKYFRLISFGLTVLAITDLVVGMSVERGDGSHTGFTGFNATTLNANIGTKWEQDVSFQTILAVLLPGATGILPGISLSGELRNAHKAIPRGIAYAWLLSFVTYLVMAVCVAASFDGKVLREVVAPLQDPARHYLYAPGEICACFASVLAGLGGTAKVMQGMSKDDVVPLLGPVAKFVNKRRWVTLLAAWLPIQCLIFIAQTVAYKDASAWASVVFCTVFLALNFGTFLSRVTGVSSFRPTYAFFNKLTALAGAIGSIIIMFIVSPLGSAAAISFLVVLVIGFEALHDPTRIYWGDAAQPVWFHLVRKWLLMLDVRKEHPSHWRPNVLQVTSDVELSQNLIHFANNLKKGGLYQLGIVIKGDFLSARVSVARWQDVLLSFIRSSGIKGFPAVAYAGNFREGIQQLLTGSGLGGMRPNTLLLCIDDYCERHKHVQRAFLHTSVRSFTSRVGGNASIRSRTRLGAAGAGDGGGGGDAATSSMRGPTSGVWAVPAAKPSFAPKPGRSNDAAAAAAAAASGRWSEKPQSSGPLGASSDRFRTESMTAFTAFAQRRSNAADDDALSEGHGDPLVPTRGSLNGRPEQQREDDGFVSPTIVTATDDDASDFGAASPPTRTLITKRSQAFRRRSVTPGVADKPSADDVRASRPAGRYHTRTRSASVANRAATPPPRAGTGAFNVMASDDGRRSAAAHRRSASDVSFLHSTGGGDGPHHRPSEDEPMSPDQVVRFARAAHRDSLRKAEHEGRYPATQQPPHPFHNPLTHNPIARKVRVFTTNRSDADEDEERAAVRKMAKLRADAALVDGPDVLTYDDESDLYGTVSDGCRSHFSVLLARNFLHLDRDDVARGGEKGTDGEHQRAFIDVWLPMESDAIVFLTAHCISQTSVWAHHATLRVVGMSWTEEEAAEAKRITEQILAHHRIRAEVFVIVMQKRCEAVFDAVKPLLVQHYRASRSSQMDAAAASGPASAPVTRPASKRASGIRRRKVVGGEQPQQLQHHAADGAPSSHVRAAGADDPTHLSPRGHRSPGLARSGAAFAFSAPQLSCTLADIAMENLNLDLSQQLHANSYHPGLDDNNGIGSDGEEVDSSGDDDGGAENNASIAAQRGGGGGDRQFSASVDFRTMGSFVAAMGNDDAEQDAVFRRAFAASIADPIQRGITLNHIIRDEVKRNGSRTKLVLMRTDDPLSASRTEHECRDADFAAREKEEALNWATHVDLLTDGLPPTVLFCGGGSMMKTADW